MIIPLVATVGTGPTELAAFDDALLRAGVGNRNLIYLSSVLPPASRVTRLNHIEAPGEWGDRLYVVAAQHRVSTPGEWAWAGVGWVQDDTGRGLLVEHHGDAEPDVTKLIETSLEALTGTRQFRWSVHDFEVIGVQCTGDPVCALVIAVFESVPWRARTRASR